MLAVPLSDMSFDDREQFQRADKGPQTPNDGSLLVPIPARKRALRVLIADDNRDAADTLAMIVELWGHKARVAYAGGAALEVAFAYEPDVLLLNIAMPQMNGYDLARRICQEDRFENALLIAITGYADEGHRLLAETAGFDHYLVKPFEMSHLEFLFRLANDRLAGSAQAALVTRWKDVLPVFHHNLTQGRRFLRLFAGETGNDEKERRNL